MMSGVRVPLRPCFTLVLRSDRAVLGRPAAIFSSRLRADLHLRHHRLRSTESAIAAVELRDASEGWLLDCEIRQCSRHTRSRRRRLLVMLRTWLDDSGHADCG